MKYLFHAYGHPNILGTHKTTFEFTKDEELSLKGDCIIGVKADFELEGLKEFIKSLKNNKISITISSSKIHEIIFAEVNPDFNDDKEFVVRKANFVSKRTFATGSNKAALDLDRNLISFLKERGSKISISLESSANMA